MTFTFSLPALARQTLTIGVLLCSSLGWASNCELTQERPIAFSAPASQDTLRVHIFGDSCSEAEVDIMVVNRKQQLLYQYTGRLTDLMPYKLPEAQLESLADLFAQHILKLANSRSTQYLPRYTDAESFYEATNDFVIISEDEYEALRQQDRPIIWHATGDASWVHLVYDAEQQTSRVIMRGGVFE